MPRLVLGAALALTCFLFLARGATAHTYGFTCTGAAGELQLRLNGASAWTSTDGGAGTMAKPVAGDTIRINGTTNNILCTGDIFVNTSGLTFKNHVGTDALVATDDIDGMFEVAGAQITIDGIELLCTACSPATANTTGLSNFPEDGNLVLHDGAVVLLENAKVAGGQTSGVFLTGNSAISVVGATIVGNVQAGSGAGPYASGIFAGQGSSVRLGNPDGTGTVTVAGNGFVNGACPGFGVLLAESSSLHVFTATVGGVDILNSATSQNSCGQILLQSGSSARIEGTAVTQTTAPAPALQALGGSSFIVTTGAVPAGTTISSGNNGAILLAGVSTGVLNGSTISATGTSVPSIEASGSSTITLAGGNTISNATTGGIAFQIDHSSSLTQVPAHQFGFTDAADTISGGAFVQVQSSMDIGIGLISSNPSLNWTVSSGNCILIQQNSSFRMSGGVAITGAPAAACTLNGGAVSTTIVFQQESNGFFNLSRGGTDNISGGGVSCLFAGMPNAHITGKANISPAGAQPAIIGSWSAANTAVSPGCLGP